MLWWGLVVLGLGLPVQAEARRAAPSTARTAEAAAGAKRSPEAQRVEAAPKPVPPKSTAPRPTAPKPPAARAPGAKPAAAKSGPGSESFGSAARRALLAQRAAGKAGAQTNGAKPAAKAAPRAKV
jgi:translation initiation factor IF-2